MKKYILVFLLSFFGMSLHAQYFYLPPVNTGSNPGGLNNDDEFPLGGGLDPSWTLIQGPSTTPVWSPNQTIPFTFNFNGAPVTQYKVSTTGVLTFTTGATAVPGTSNTALPSFAIPNNSLMVWGINGSGTNDNIVRKTFGTAPNRQHWVFFPSYSYPGLTGWNYFSIVLEEGTDKIYFVDQRSNQNPSQVNLTVGIQIDGLTAIQDVNSPNVNTNTSTSLPDRSDNWYWEFIPGAQAQFDLTVTDNTMNTFLNLNAGPFPVTGTISNLGTATVNSLDLNYSVNGGATVTSNISGLNLASLGDYNFTHPINWNPSVSQSYDISIWASNINGNVDENTANDTLTSQIQVVDTVLERNALHEVFTSSSCAPCNPGNANTNAIFAASSETPVILKYQMSWPGTGDPYYTLEGLTRRTYYGVNSVPNMAVDGGWNGNTNSYTGSLLNQFSAVPSFMDIHSEIRVECKTVIVDVTVTPYSDFPGNNVLHVAVLEKLTFNNVSTNGETSFDHVMKKMLPNGNGTTIGNLVKNVPQTFSFSYTFNGNYILPPNATQPINHASNNTIEEFFDLDVVAFVQENNTKEVYQATYSEDLIGYDVSLKRINSINNANVGTPITIAGQIENWKDSATSSLNINYSIDNGPVVTETLTSLNMNTKGLVRPYSFATAWLPSSAGSFTVKVWIDNFNGGNSIDDSHCNDTLEQVVSVASAAPVAGFTFVETGLVVDFTNTSTLATSYSWDFGDGATDTAENPIHTYATNGSYQVCLTATNSQGNNVNCQTVNLVGVGLVGNDLSKSISIFPNPSNGEITISSDRNLSGVIEVIDLLGKNIYKDEVVNWNSGKISLGNVKSGVYILRILTSEGMMSRNILID